MAGTEQPPAPSAEAITDNSDSDSEFDEAEAAAQTAPGYHDGDDDDGVNIAYSDHDSSDSDGDGNSDDDREIVDVLRNELADHVNTDDPRAALYYLTNEAHGLTLAMMLDYPELADKLGKLIEELSGMPGFDRDDAEAAVSAARRRAERKRSGWSERPLNLPSLGVTLRSMSDPSVSGLPNMSFVRALPSDVEPPAVSRVFDDNKPSSLAYEHYLAAAGLVHQRFGAYVELANIVVSYLDPTHFAEHYGLSRADKTFVAIMHADWLGRLDYADELISAREEAGETPDVPEPFADPVDSDTVFSPIDNDTASDSVDSLSDSDSVVDGILGRGPDVSDAVRESVGNRIDDFLVGRYPEISVPVAQVLQCAALEGAVFPEGSVFSGDSKPPKDRFQALSVARRLRCTLDDAVTVLALARQFAPFAGLSHAHLLYVFTPAEAERWDKPGQTWKPFVSSDPVLQKVLSKQQRRYDAWLAGYDNTDVQEQQTSAPTSSDELDLITSAMGAGFGADDRTYSGVPPLSDDALDFAAGDGYRVLGGALLLMSGHTGAADLSGVSERLRPALLLLLGGHTGTADLSGVSKRLRRALTNIAKLKSSRLFKKLKPNTPVHVADAEAGIFDTDDTDGFVDRAVRVHRMRRERCPSGMTLAGAIASFALFDAIWRAEMRHSKSKMPPDSVDERVRGWLRWVTTVFPSQRRAKEFEVGGGENRNE